MENTFVNIRRYVSISSPFFHSVLPLQSVHIRKRDLYHILAEDQTLCRQWKSRDTLSNPSTPSSSQTFHPSSNSSPLSYSPFLVILPSDTQSGFFWLARSLDPFLPSLSLACSSDQGWEKEKGKFFAELKEISTKDFAEMSEGKILVQWMEVRENVRFENETRKIDVSIYTSLLLSAKLNFRNILISPRATLMISTFAHP